VTNFDTHVWEAGSFYANAATASPGGFDTRKFAGIAYGIVDTVTPANSRLVIEARDLDDTSVPGIVWVREKIGAAAWSTWVMNAQDDKVSKLPAGDTMQGELTIQTAGHARLQLSKANGTGGFVVAVNSYSGLMSNPASVRWSLQLGDGSNESGGNAGSNYVLRNFNDAGAPIATPMSISRATGIVSVIDGSGAFGPVAGKAYADTKFPTIGGVMTGGLYIQAISASFTLDDTGTGGAASMFFKTRGANAWQLNVAGDFDNGSFQFIRFNPLGTAVDVPLHIHRLTGRVTVGAGAGAVIAGPTTVQGILTANAAINMLGDLGITKVLPRIVLDRSDNSNAGINGRRSGVDRWQVDFGETSGDSSTATGSDFVWHRFNNAGAYMGAAMRLDRPSATLTISGIVQPTGYICRAGTGGGTSNVFNIYWSSPNAPLYIDNSLMGNLTYSSDYRVKENVIDLTTMVDRVKALRPISFTYADYMPPWEMDAQAKRRQRVIDDLADKARAAAVAAGADIDGAIAAADEARAKAEAEVGEPGPFMVKDTREQWGFIAHELQETLIETAATGEKDAEGIIQSPNPWTVIAALTKALQEMIARVEALENAP
jgi:hypothetical protein